MTNDAVRRSLYSDAGVPPILTAAAAAEKAGPFGGVDISFLDHAWGKTPPSALTAAIKRQYGLYAMGNSTWDVLFAEVMPTAAAHVKAVLGLTGHPHTVEFGHNSHELVMRMLSTRLGALMVSPPAAPVADGDAPAPCLRILTTDTEFYSLTRQLNRFAELQSERIVIESVPIEPLGTFPARFASQAGVAPGYDFVYASQCVYSTQETIVPDVPAFAAAVGQALIAAAAAGNRCWWAQGAGAVAVVVPPTFILDGYHGFGAIPTDLSKVHPQQPPSGAAGAAVQGVETIYVSGMLKHVASGANCAFMVLPPAVAAELRPLLTGWLADPSVLGPESAGIKLGSDVGYMSQMGPDTGLALMGSTPALAPCLLTFNEVMRAWAVRGITVALVHAHVMRLHARFIAGLEQLEAEAATAAANGAGGASGERGPKEEARAAGGISIGILHSLLPAAHRSHTLVFDQPEAGRAKAVVETLRKRHKLEVDSRKTYVRVGFGFNHHAEDVDRLLAAVASGL